MLSIAIFVTIASAVAVPLIGSYLSGRDDLLATRAGAIAEETWEAVRSIRDNGWEDLVTGSHGLTRVNGFWEFTSINDVYEGITRSVIVKMAFRDGEGELVQEGGVADPDTRIIEIRLSWQPTPYVSRALEIPSVLTHYP
jgi:hypothetical protein